MEDITSYKKFFAFSIVFLALLISIPIISAAQFDSVKSDLIFGEGISRYGKIEIDNWFGFGEKLAEVELLDNSDICGVDCYAEGKTTLYSKGTLIQSLRANPKYDKIYDFKVFISDGTKYETQYDFSEDCSKKIL